MLERIRILASDPEILKALVAETNRQLSGANVLIAEKLDDLADGRRGMQGAIDELQVSIGQIQRQAVDETVVRHDQRHSKLPAGDN